MTTQLELSVVRIRMTNGIVIGAGFLAGARQVLTCAHVVARALGLLNGTPETSQAEVCLNLPLVAPGRILIARIISGVYPGPAMVASIPCQRGF